jgi:hypothetical protein
MMLALVLTTLAVARARRDDPALPGRLAFRTPFARLTLSAFRGATTRAIAFLAETAVGTFRPARGFTMLYCWKARHLPPVIERR